MSNKKIPTPVLFFLFAAAIIIPAVIGWWFTEIANKPFWWTFWVVLAIIFLIGFGVWWAINWSKGNRK